MTAKATRRPERYIGPRPSVSFGAHVGQIVPLIAAFSGEIAANTQIRSIGAAPFHGKVRDVWMSVNASGKRDSDCPRISGEVYINGTSCLTTLPMIAHISGESSTQKTTKVDGDTGITRAVLNGARTTFLPGDIFTAEIKYGGNASPTTKISNAVIVVELEPFVPGTP